MAAEARNKGGSAKGGRKREQSGAARGHQRGEIAAVVLLGVEAVVVAPWELGAEGVQPGVVEGAEDCGDRGTRVEGLVESGERELVIGFAGEFGQ